MRGLMASVAWGILMAAVITPGFELTQVQNLLGTIAGALMMTVIFNK